MSLDELLRQRRMVRDYLPTPLDSQQLLQVLERALRAPTAGHSQGVSLVAVTEQEKRAAIARAADEAAWVARGYPAWLSVAPAHVVLCAEPDVYRQRYQESDKNSARHPDSWPVPYWYVDAGAAFMTLLLAAAEQGWAAGFQGIHNFHNLAELLGLPAGAHPLGVVTLGHAASRRAGSSTRRGTRAGRIHWQQW